MTVLRSHPGWTLGELLDHVGAANPRADVLASLTLGELMTDPRLAIVAVPDDGGPLIDNDRLARARRSSGASFDRIVLEVIAEARRPIGAAYLRARVGNQRWKLGASLRRLISAGRIRRSGSTSATRYRLVDA